jgi:hypothetical protein
VGNGRNKIVSRNTPTATCSLIWGKPKQPSNHSINTYGAINQSKQKHQRCKTRFPKRTRETNKKIPKIMNLACLLLLLVVDLVRGDILSKLPNCNGCHCLGETADTCPALPTIDRTAVNTFKVLPLENPILIRCDPFLSPSCIVPAQEGEACVAELVPPATGATSCPQGYSYR